MEPAFLSRPAPAWERLATLLFPASCLACGAGVEEAGWGALCRGCWRGVDWLEGERGLRPAGPALDSARSAGAFEGALRQAIHAYKFSGKTSFRRPFAALLAQGAPQGAAAVAWPPSTPESLKERGFDPMGELAATLARLLGLGLAQGLKRARPGLRQVGLDRAARRKNAAHAFSAELPAALKGRDILVVDDVVTTGATLEEAARALKEAGAARVLGMTLASDSLRGN